MLGFDTVGQLGLSKLWLEQVSDLHSTALDAGERGKDGK